MLVTINKRRVEVKDRECAKRECFALGFDKGSFTQGRGYTNYHTDSKGRRVEKPVCATRHYHGCPVNSVCLERAISGRARSLRSATSAVVELGGYIRRARAAWPDRMVAEVVRARVTELRAHLERAGARRETTVERDPRH